MEVWKPVIGFDGYEVSDLGRVRSFKCRTTPGRILSPGWKGTARYKAVCLFGEDFKRYEKVHHLVLCAFIGPCPEGMEGCHNNGIHTDNKLSNLRWDTHTANMRDVCFSENKDRKKRALSLSDVLSIRADKRTGVTLALEYRVTSACISRIRLNQTWKHLSNQQEKWNGEYS